jgi:hypothetical protein
MDLSRKKSAILKIFFIPLTLLSQLNIGNKNIATCTTFKSCLIPLAKIYAL